MTVGYSTALSLSTTQVNEALLPWPPSACRDTPLMPAQYLLTSPGRASAGHVSPRIHAVVKDWLWIPQGGLATFLRPTGDPQPLQDYMWLSPHVG